MWAVRQSRRAMGKGGIVFYFWFLVFGKLIHKLMPDDAKAHGVFTTGTCGNGSLDRSTQFAAFGLLRYSLLAVVKGGVARSGMQVR